jgi:hypothetical protein
MTQVPSPLGFPPPAFQARGRDGDLGTVVPEATYGAEVAPRLKQLQRERTIRSASSGAYRR